MGKSFKSVLLVDDESDILELLEFEFDTEGYEVMKASDGAQALEILKTKKVDLVISDVFMPHCDGRELLERSHKEAPHHPPFIFMSGKVIDDKDELIRLGALDIITKPFTFQELIKRVLYLLEKEEQAAI